MIGLDKSHLTPHGIDADDIAALPSEFTSKGAINQPPPGFAAWKFRHAVEPSGVPIAADEMPGRLAEAAFALFSRRGIERVRMDDIAAAAGVTKGSLFWHYQSKSEVIHAVRRFPVIPY
jgi:hypothetical protein